MTNTNPAQTTSSENVSLAGFDDDEEGEEEEEEFRSFCNLWLIL